MKKRIEIDKELLERLYLKDGLSHKKIGLRLGVSEPTIRARFRDHGLVVRLRGSWMVRYPKKPFTGSQQEKAYMMGFRVGDVNVYVPSKGANIIVARTNSTHENQLQIMRSLFSQYGGVVVSGNGTAKNINCYLDTSFSFLLVDKPYDVDSWIRQDSQNCLAFMAGYIDAEGNFIVSQGRARFKLDSYDAAILHWMHAWLLANGMKPKLRLLARKGDASYNGGYWNGDLWRLNVNEADSLLRFCNSIMPYLRHRKRINDVQECVDNIMNRKKNGTV